MNEKAEDKCDLMEFVTLEFGVRLSVPDKVGRFLSAETEARLAELSVSKERDDGTMHDVYFLKSEESYLPARVAILKDLGTPDRAWRVSREE